MSKTNKNSYLVIVLDKADHSCFESVVKAKDSDTAGLEALKARMKELELNANDDAEGAGLKVVLTFNKEGVLKILKEME